MALPFPEKCLLTKDDLLLCAMNFFDDLTEQEKDVFYSVTGKEKRKHKTSFKFIVFQHRKSDLKKR